MRAEVPRPSVHPFTSDTHRLQNSQGQAGYRGPSPSGEPRLRGERRGPAAGSCTRSGVSQPSQPSLRETMQGHRGAPGFPPAWEPRDHRDVPPGVSRAGKGSSLAVTVGLPLKGLAPLGGRRVSLWRVWPRLATPWEQDSSHSAGEEMEPGQPSACFLSVGSCCLMLELARAMALPVAWAGPYSGQWGV